MKAVKDTVELWSSASDRGSNVSLTHPTQNKDNNMVYSSWKAGGGASPLLNNTYYNLIHMTPEQLSVHLIEQSDPNPPLDTLDRNKDLIHSIHVVQH